jgi:hypothetical protein
VPSAIGIEGERGGKIKERKKRRQSEDRESGTLANSTYSIFG